MTITSKIMTIGSVIIIALVSSCDKPPEQKLSEAKEAITKAKEAQADQFANNDFTAAQKTLDAANAAIQAENKKLTFARNYLKASNLLNEVIKLSDEAIDAANLEKERIRAEEEQAQIEAEKKKTEKATARKAKRSK